MNPIKMIPLVILVVAAISGCSDSGAGKPAVAIDGSIVFASPHKGGKYADIYLLDAQGTRRLAGAGFVNQSYPVWSPDGTQIAYITDKWQLAVVKSDGSGGAFLTPETSDGSLWPSRPAWLPDGNISFFAAGKLAVMRPDGSGVRVLALSSPNWKNSFSGAYAWSPDGTQIVFDCTAFSSSEVCLFDVESGESRTLLEPPWRFQAFAWSPDGKKILAGDWCCGTQGGEELPEDLYIFDADGSGLHALAQPGSEANPAWSPDGKMIVYDAFTENSEGSSQGLWVMNADGSGAQQLLSGITGVQPDWTAGSRAQTVLSQATDTATSTPGPSATRATTVTASSPRAVVTTDVLNVRTGPGTNYPKIGVLRKGDQVGVTGRTKTGDWLAVTLADGKKGWVAASLVKLDVPVSGIAEAQNIPKPPTPAATSKPVVPKATLTIDEQIAAVAKGTHGALPQPGDMGGVSAGGETEVTIVNDTPHVLTVLVGSPSSTSITIEACSSCKHYSVGPSSCQEEGRPKRTIRLKPGSSQVVARVDDRSVTPFLGTWELKPDTAYFNCFFIVVR